MQGSVSLSADGTILAIGAYGNDSSKGRTRSSDGGSKIPTFMAGDKGKILYKFKINIVDKVLPIVDVAWCENTINRISDRLDKMKQGQDSADLYKLYKGH